jgi:thioesterase domain-containing protein
LLKTRVRPRSMESVEPLKRAIWTSNLNYAGDSVDFPVALFTSSRSVNQTHDRTLGWAAWLRGGFQLHPLTGKHSTLFDQDCVAHNAEILRNSIEAETLMRRDQPNVTSSSPQ